MSLYSSSGGAASSSGHHQHQHQHKHHHHQVVEEVSVQRVKKEEVNAKISAWQNNKIAKINNRFKRKNAIIEGWESEQTNKLYQLLSNNPIAFCLLVAWVGSLSKFSLPELLNASNSNEQHDMEINSARVAVEEDVAKNSKDLFEQFDDSRQQKNVLGSSRKLGQTGQSSNSNDVKTFRDKYDKVDELLTSPTPKASAKALPSMSHENNFLIVHPDILLSGTRVAGSFGCLRRTVLDERLKCNEYSTAALTGTLLHQIFQAGLTEDNPSIDFLEGYTEVVLLRNIESLYACGVNESDVRKTLIDAVPRILSWILRFTNKEENEDPNVCFGFHNRPNKVTISEASSNLTDSFYPLVWILEELNKSPGERENIEWILEELNNFNSVWP
ncbi:hypothetical protein AHAS_Ahas11G0210300 [Arachis hypogaea]